MKYVIVKIGKIITQIAKPTDVDGYTIGILESFMPEKTEMDKMTDEQIDDFIEENNKRMTAICEFLNDNNL